MPKKIILAVISAVVTACAVFAAILCDIAKAPKRSVFPEYVTVFISEKNRIEKMPYEKFVEGCLCGIIPATKNTYEEQTLAAIAVIINTNALIALNEKSGFENFCADFTVSAEFPYVSYNDKAVNHADRKLIQAAVKTANGAYLADKGKPVAVKMCAISSGKTESQPFMPSKELPEDALAKGYLTERAFSEKEVLQAFSSVNLCEKSPDEWFSNPVYNEFGSLVSVDFLSQKLSGDEIRSALKLKSSAISVDYRAETFFFRCKGSGENVGMSLNAANIAAQNGKKYGEILSEFYTLDLVT